MISEVDTVPTEKHITPDELIMLTQLKNNVVAKYREYETSQNVFGYALEILREKYGCSEREVVSETGQIVEMTEEAFNKLNVASSTANSS